MTTAAVGVVLKSLLTCCLRKIRNVRGKIYDSMYEGAQDDEQFVMKIDNEETVRSERSNASENSEEDEDCWK